MCSALDELVQVQDADAALVADATVGNRLDLQQRAPKAIQDHLGHRDIQTTFTVSGHLLPSAQEALAASLDAAYAGDAGPENAQLLVM